MISYAQNFEDVLLNRVFADVSHGFYVDVGANHPTTDSMTRHFYNCGWRGINIEPGSLFPTLARQRPRDINLHMAASGSFGTATFYEHPAAIGTSTLSPTLPDTVQELDRNRIAYQVEVRPLEAILAEHAPETIDFMSIDVEGYEEQVIRGNDWTRFRPRVLVVEATLPNTNAACHQRWEPLLLEADYEFVYFDGINRFYVRREDANLKKFFNRPVNVLDEFVRADMIQANAVCARFRRSLAARTEEAVELREREASLQKTVAELHERCRRYEQSLASRREESAALQGTLDSLEQTVTSLRAESAECEQALASRTEELAQLRDLSAVTERSLACREQEVASLQDRLTAHQESLAIREQEVIALQDELTAHQNALGRAHDARAIHPAPVDAQEEDASDTDADAAADTDALQKLLAMREEELQSLRQEIGRRTTQLESLESDLTRRAQEAQWLRSEVETREKHIEWVTRRTGPRSLATGLRVARKIHWLTRL